jgi:hypothetical protein
LQFEMRANDMQPNGLIYNYNGLIYNFVQKKLKTAATKSPKFVWTYFEKSTDKLLFLCVLKQKFSSTKLPSVVPYVVP